MTKHRSERDRIIDLEFEGQPSGAVLVWGLGFILLALWGAIVLEVLR